MHIQSTPVTEILHIIYAGYENTGYKNMPVLRIPVMTTYAVPNGVLITGIHCISELKIF